MIWIVVLMVIIADQVSKILCQKYLVSLGTVPVIKGIFHLTYVQNTGAAFGMFQGRNWFFIPAIILVSALLVYFIRHLKSDKGYMKISVALILGGAIGNLIDRITLGYVIDFLDFRIWPVFNIADSCVVVGAMLLGYFVIVKGGDIE